MRDDQVLQVGTGKHLLMPCLVDVVDQQAQRGALARYAAQEGVLPTRQARHEQGTWNTQRPEMSRRAVHGVHGFGQADDSGFAAAEYDLASSLREAEWTARVDDQSNVFGRVGLLASAPVVSSHASRQILDSREPSQREIDLDRIAVQTFGIVADSKAFEELAKAARALAFRRIVERQARHPARGRTRAQPEFGRDGRRQPQTPHSL